MEPKSPVDASASAGVTLRLEFVYGYNCVGQARCAFSVQSTNCDFL